MAHDIAGLECGGVVGSRDTHYVIFCVRIQLPSGFPVVVMSWLGSDPSLQSIMLNSHTVDVVPASSVCQ